ncbi:MAG: HAD family phosphatase [Actinomycetaceae bacterium]|nr:HAD family phosphatase [Arcanobacterium sp.]MDD7504460.1 HAD family phosphatase [Actinomycetaceae bacterium]MDY6143982.1 HAD family phosphatase [Arcanobacterium sp.]
MDARAHTDPDIVSPKRPAALLFDMDGTLTDSEQIWFRAEERVFGRYGIEWKDGDQLDLIGWALPRSMEYVVGKYSLDVDPLGLGDELVEEVIRIGTIDGMPWRPGAYALLENSVTWGIPSALVTSSYAGFAALTLAQAPQGSLSVQVTGDMVTRGKPDPEPFERAADLLGVSITDCVAFEDSAYGLTSAQRSGAHVIAVPFQVELPPLPGVTTIPSLEHVTLDLLATLVSPSEDA